ncbi:MAG: class B sortase [Lachnospiraceae bacterium]|nr:class B sortase [Lachnospiraceae bacterium]
MGRKIRRVIFIIALVVFIGAVGYIGYTYYGYSRDAKFYREAVSEYVTINKPEPAQSSEAENKEEVSGKKELPIEVDFEALRAVNPDIMGWIYCPDTVINYPILKAEDNDKYLRHNYLGEYITAGSIFVECANSDGFADSNTIVYGHNMHDGSMFACLSKWFEQDFYEAHPVMYILTPEKNYELQLFSAYTTKAGSDAYYAILTPCKEMNDYLERAVERSKIQTRVELPEDGHYVLLSTCAYLFENARSVVHGVLVPIE